MKNTAKNRKIKSPLEVAKSKWYNSHIQEDELRLKQLIHTKERLICKIENMDAEIEIIEQRLSRNEPSVFSKHHYKYDKDREFSKSALWKFILPYHKIRNLKNQ